MSKAQGRRADVARRQKFSITSARRPCHFALPCWLARLRSKKDLTGKIPVSVVQKRCNQVLSLARSG